MTGTSKSPKRTKRSIKSASKRRKPSFLTEDDAFQKSTMSRKRTTASQSGFLGSKGRCLLSTERPQTAKSGSSALGEFRKLSGDAWDGFDFETLPPLSNKQLDTFRNVSSKEFENFAKLGRPPKPAHKKEVPVSIRMSAEFIAAIKNAAKKKNMGWQTFLKEIVSREIDFPLEQPPSLRKQRTKK